MLMEGDEGSWLLGFLMVGLNVNLIIDDLILSGFGSFDWFFEDDGLEFVWEVVW